MRGTTRGQLGSFPAGTPYSADDPELMLWVHATLVHASLSAYQRFEHELSRAEQESYYRDMTTVAQLFGTPAALIPRTVADFRDYVASQIGSRTITVTPTAREIAQVILHAPLPAPMRMLGPAHRLATAAQLPPQLRHEYDLRWTPRHERLLALAGHSVKLASWPILRASWHLRPPLAAAA